MGKYQVIGDVRGTGLMVALEFVKDRGTKEPAKEACAQVFERCKDLGALVGKGGLNGNIIRITPPMCITKADLDFLLDVMDVALSEL
jgi:alanine-glyoxylate transaminase/(R)-3-amino-2-methylpropionate-pyruvate transaminase